MNSFSIRDIEHLCGIKAHTLRIWEQRYQLHSPKRKAGNHRTYDNDDLKYLLRVSYLYHKGHKISALAKLSEEEISQMAFEKVDHEYPADVFVNQLTEASLDFDEVFFDGTLQAIISQLGFEKAIRQVAYPFLKRIGLLWMTGNVVPAQEHFASALISRKMQVAIQGLGQAPEGDVGGAAGVRGTTGGSVPDAGKARTAMAGSAVEASEVTGGAAKKVLIYAPKGEFHEIPLLYMRYLMKKNRIPAVYFGMDISLDELQYYCQQKPVSHLYFHLVTNLLRCEPDQYVKKLIHLFPDKQIVISGRVGAELRATYPNTRVLRELEEMEAFAEGRDR